MVKLNYHLHWISCLKINLLTPLASFCDEYLWEIQETVVIEKIDVEFYSCLLYSFDHTIGFNSFWCVDLM